ncbi:MAG: aminotransferase class I/II-fold pyridoxal phosphate-dependent enzyme [Anaerolineales bacterium]|nr:aminotransferase class I/II-fold pyridoxal phosphate-dependent enzyme [Anaerolineales bacterium]MDW8448190.1 aminotransferase class I/II-fold pyridoxal phosphate-dependent enzyme [Anaerolineales bacterium]
MKHLSSRLNKIPASVISEMNNFARLYKAINLASGYPDFNPPEALVEAAVNALRKGYHQYADTAGRSSLRQAIARKFSRFSGLEVDGDAHVTVTVGSTEAMFLVLAVICEPGDRVLIFSPFYENYAAGLHLLDAQPVYVHLRPPEFLIDREALRREFKRGAKAIIICNPANPSGKVFTEEELLFIGSLAQEFDAYVITDEVYEHIVFPPHRHVYAAALPGMFERTITCSSLSKTYAITGWRLGTVIADEVITEQIRLLHDYITLGAPAPLQLAARTALEFPDEYYAEIARQYAERRDIFLEYLERSGFGYIPPQGTYFVLADISGFDFDDDVHFCYWMVRTVGVAAVPGSSFFAEPVKHLVRFNFAKRPETLHEAGERLMEIKKLR